MHYICSGEVLGVEGERTVVQDTVHPREAP